MEKKFKCKDEVIYRFKGGAGLGDPDPWIYGIFSHYKKDGDIVVNGNSHRAMLTDILAYEGNEHLVGTTDEPKAMEEELKLKEGDLVIFLGCTDNIEERNHFFMERLQKIRKADFLSKTGNEWEFAIRFKDFDPSNMEETKKHILCVKNGEIIQYKG